MGRVLHVFILLGWIEYLLYLIHVFFLSSHLYHFAFAVPKKNHNGFEFEDTKNTKKRNFDLYDKSDKGIN
jgi:hypothetical protein